MKEEVNDRFKKHDEMQEKWEDEDDPDNYREYDDWGQTPGGPTPGGPTPDGMTTKGGPTPSGYSSTTRGGPSTRAAEIDYDPSDIAGYLKRKQEVDRKKEREREKKERKMAKE